MFYFSNARSFPLIVFSLLERFGIFLCPRYIAAPGWEVGNPVAGQRLSFVAGGCGSFRVRMWPVNSGVSDLISRIQRLLPFAYFGSTSLVGDWTLHFLKSLRSECGFAALQLSYVRPGLRNSELSSTSIVGCLLLRTPLKKPWNNRLWCSEVLSGESRKCQLE